MKQTKWICDKCRKEITDVVYRLTCFAEDVDPGPRMGVSAEVAQQNMKQNMARAESHLCRACKDAITDGVFIV